MAFEMDLFIEKNHFSVDSMEMKEKIEQALKNGEPVGFVSKGSVAGMIPGELQFVGTNAIFPNGIYASYTKEAPCSEATLHLIPKVLNLGLVLEEGATKADVEAFLEHLEQLTGIFKASVKSISMDEAAPAFKMENYVNQTFPQKQWEQAVEPLSQTDMMLGKKNDETVSERLALCGIKEGHLLCKEQRLGPVRGALALDAWQVDFSL